ncbi:MAG: DnaJ C-terminal domain-containing protein, partial [Gammaproteobacteria bacterium]|nr:DnaJ C-terminal domain-containing protein [Gammaproteobacteria bacterium]
MPGIKTETFYDKLGVAKNASQEDLRKAWLGLARKYHPDKTGGDTAAENKLKALNEAYDTLKRPEKRRQYDETLAAPFQGSAPPGAGAAQGRAPFNGSGNGENFEFSGDYADVFADLFRQHTQGRQRGPQPGRDLETEVSLSLKDSATGTRKSFRLPSMVPCEACAGTGAAQGTSAQTCPQCHGSGHISAGRGSLFEMSQACPRCRGRGSIIPTPCPTCEGSGARTEMRTVSIAIPAGIKSGARLRLAGQGEPGETGAPNGDLMVVITVKDDALFKRKRNDLLCDVPITFTQAVLGDDIEVPTLNGKVRLNIPP